MFGAAGAELDSFVDNSLESIDQKGKNSSEEYRTGISRAALIRESMWSGLLQFGSMR